MLYLIFLLIFGSIFILISYYSSGYKEEKMVRERFMPGSAKKKKRKGASPLLTIGHRGLSLIAPLNKCLKLQAARESIQKDLTTTGSSLTVDEFFALQEVFLVLLPAIIYIFLTSAVTPMWLVLLAAIGYILPKFWLRRKVTQRQFSISRDLPDVIDLLTLSVGAGLDFMMALRKVVERFKPGPLVDELALVWQETKMGKSRRDALKAMAQRVNLPDVSSFTRTLVQADRMGTSIAEALRMQSEECRRERFERGERIALKAPIKMLLPLLLFILPVVLIIVAGPILLQFMQGEAFSTASAGLGM